MIVQQYIRQQAVRLGLALGLLALLALAEFAVRHTYFGAYRQAAAAGAASARCWALCLQVTTLCHELAHPGAEPFHSQQDLRSELMQSVEALRQADSTLRALTGPRGIRGGLLDRIQVPPVSPLTDSLLDRFLRVAALAAGGQPADSLAAEAWQLGFTGLAPHLAEYDAQVRDALARSIEGAQATEPLILVLSILIIGLSWWLVFRPLLRNLNQQLRRVLELHHSNEQLEQFVFIASHDLKEPLRTISNYVQLLQRRYAPRLDEDANEYIGIAVQNVKRMYALLEDLSYFTKVGYQQLRIEPIETRRLVEEVLSALESKIFNSQAQLQVLALPDVRADRTQLSLLFQNLIDNAIKYRRPGQAPAIEISGEEQDGCWIFHIQDNGIGIEPEFQERIFNFFERVHNQEAFYEGTGVGLALCRKIAKNHHGKIWVQSAPGQGSRFSFEISKRLILP